MKLFPVHQCTIFDSAPADFSQRLSDIYVAFRDVAGFGWAGPEHPFFILLLAFQLALLFVHARAAVDADHLDLGQELRQIL